MWRWVVRLLLLGLCVAVVLYRLRTRTKTVYLKDLLHTHLTPAAFDTFLAWNLYKEQLPQGYEVICTCEATIHIGIPDNLAYPWYIIKLQTGELTVRFMNKAGEMENGPGKQIYSDGSFAECEFVGESCSGKGKVYSAAENSYYEGDFKDGLKHGFGSLIQLFDVSLSSASFAEKKWPDTVYTYTGEFDTGELHGYGHFSAFNFSYNGQFQHGNMTGPGQMTIGNKTLVGQFEGGQLHGYGCEQDSVYVICGVFKQGERDGKAVRMPIQKLQEAKYLSYREGVENWW